MKGSAFFERFKSLTSVWWDLVSLMERILKFTSNFVLNHLCGCAQVLLIAVIFLLLFIAIKKIKGSAKKNTSYPEIEKLKKTEESPQPGDPVGFYLILMYILVALVIMTFIFIYMVEILKL